MEKYINELKEMQRDLLDIEHDQALEFKKKIASCNAAEVDSIVDDYVSDVFKKERQANLIKIITIIEYLETII